MRFISFGCSKYEVIDGLSYEMHSLPLVLVARNPLRSASVSPKTTTNLTGSTTFADSTFKRCVQKLNTFMMSQRALLVPPQKAVSTFWLWPLSTLGSERGVGSVGVVGRWG